MTDVIIQTPRPPLNLFEVVRAPVDDTSGGTLLYNTPIYRIPADGPNPQRDVETAAILTNMIVANTSAGAATVSVWVEDASANTFWIAVALPIAQNGYIKIDLDKQVLKSRDKLYAEMSGGDTAIAHLSFVLNLREEFTVIGA